MPLLKKTVSVLALALLVTACGSSKGDRALSGAGIGAAAGGIGGAMMGHAGTGAAIGAATGAAAGALTDEDDVNLGKPVWR